VLSAALLGIPDPLVNARENGIFRSYKINGVPAINILLMPVLTTVFHLVIVTVVIGLTSRMIFDVPMPTDWVQFAIVFVAGVFASTGLGVLIGVLAPNSRLTVLFSQAIYLPSMLLGGLMIPTSALPEVAQPFSFLLPSAHIMNAFQSLAMGVETGFDAWLSVGVLVSGGVLALGAAWFLFQWDNRSGERRAHPLVGLIALLPYVISMVLLR
jgi:ABC-2 type transport system permease protein